MSTFVPGSIMVRDGHRNTKTEQRTAQHTQSMERDKRDQRQGRWADWESGLE